MISPVAYELKLPAELKIHPVFHVSRLKAYTPSPTKFTDRRKESEPVLVRGQIEYEVEKILNKRTYHRKLQYLVQFKGETYQGAKWIHSKDLQNAQEAIEEYETRVSS